MKCCHFGHFARACTISKAPIWDKRTPTNKLPTWNERRARGLTSMPPNQIVIAIKIDGKKQGFKSKNPKKVMDAIILVVETRACQTLWPLSKNPATKNAKRNQTLGQWKQNTSVNNEKDQAMGKPEVFLTHSLVKNLSIAQLGDKRMEEGADGCNTPKIKFIFNLSRGCNGLSQRKWANANPFETLNEEDEAFSFLRKAPEALEGGWTFQGKKKHKVKIEPTHPATGHPPHFDGARQNCPILIVAMQNSWGKERSKTFGTPPFLC
jgi:hypothetical protein